MPFVFEQEKVFNEPIPEGGVSYGTVSPSNITLLALVNGALLSPSYSYQTVTIELRSISPGALPDTPTLDTFGDTFTFRDKTWTILKVEKGSSFTVGTNEKLYSASITGVDLDNPILSL